jgi:hypothetical protein
MSMVILRMIGKLYEKVLKISALEKLKAWLMNLIDTFLIQELPSQFVPLENVDFAYYCNLKTTKANGVSYGWAY